MESLDSLNMVQQGSEASHEYSQRRTRAEQNEAQKQVEEVQDNGATDVLQWRDCKNEQLNAFLKQLEKSGIQRNKFEVSA
jgi:hypothetical protein